MPGSWRGLFREVGEAHQPYIETDGADPEWLLWYADYLRDKLGTLLDANFTRSELLYLLVLVAHEQPLSAPDANWARYYAKFFTGSTGNLVDRADTVPNHPDVSVRKDD